MTQQNSQIGVLLRKLSPRAEFFDSWVWVVIRSCFSPYMEAIEW